MEQYNGKQDHSHTPNHADNQPFIPGDALSHGNAPATLLPAVLHRLGLDNASPIHQPTAQNALNDLQSNDWQIRVAAVRTLGTLGQQASIKPLLAALQDEDDSVRAAAIHALTTLGEQVPIEHFIAALHDPAWHVRETAILALAQRHQSLPPNVFDEVLRDQDSTVREAAQLALQWTRQGRVLPQLQSTSATSVPLVQPAQLQDTPKARSRQHMQPQHMQPATPSQNHLSTQNNYGKQHKNNSNQGASMREQRTQPAMQDPEYEYYTYGDDNMSRQWEKVTSYAPKKNQKPLWIGGIIGVAVFFIAAASAWTLFAHNAAVLQIGFMQPTVMPQVTPMPVLSSQTVYIYQNHHAPVNAVAWSPDSTRIASASDDMTVQVWDALTGNKPYIFGGHTSPVDTVAWSPNGQLIASGSVDDTIKVWDPNNGRVDLTYHFFQAADIAHIGALQAFSGGDPGTYSLVWSPDGSRIAAAMGSSVVKVFDAHTGNTLFSYANFSDKITALAWSPNGKYIITAGANNTTTIWNANNGTTVFTSPIRDRNSVFSLAWSSDSKRIAIGYLDGTVRVWNPFSGSFLAVNVRSQNVYALAWSPDGTRLATASIDDTVRVLNATTGEQLAGYTGYTNGLNTITVAWSPNGSFIASGSSDDTVQVWKAP